MNFDTENVKIFKKVLDNAVDTRLQNYGITSYMSAIVHSINEDGSINVVLPPNTTIINNLLNKTGEVLSIDDSVELCTKNGKLSNAWVALKHGTNVSGGGSGSYVELSQLVTTVVDDDTKVPTSGAIVDYVAGLGGGDMLKSAYDPNNKNADVFDMTNMVEGTTNKIFTATERTKLAGIANGAEVNVNADWNAVSGDAQILNKPTIPTQTSQLTNNSNFVSDASYVHTDNNYTTTEKNKLSGLSNYTLPTATDTVKGGIKIGTRLTITNEVLSADVQSDNNLTNTLKTDYDTAYTHSQSAHAPSNAEQNVQADWNQTNNTQDDYIKNKPILSAVATSGSYNDLSNTPTIPTTLFALTDDTTHRLVTDTEKSTWNGKQDALGFTAVPTTRTVNSQALSANITLTTADIADSTNKRYITDAQLTSVGTIGNKANDSAVVHNIGDETIAGIKTFSSFLITPSSAPTTDYQVANRKFVLDSVAGAGGGDMMKSTYDPTNKSADVFNMDNMVEGTTNKILTSAERTKLTNTSGTNSGDNAINTLYSGLVTNATHTGEVTGSGALTITSKAVTLAKMADMATASLIYRKTAGTGVPEVQTLATLKTDLGLTGTNSGDQIVPENTSATANQFFTAYNNSTGAFTKAQPTWANINKSTSSIADITTKSHTLLTDIGINTHAQIDTALTRLANTSGTNTGDNAVNSLYSGLSTSKQDTLVSGTNIKTINGNSLLGSGDIPITSGGGVNIINASSSTAAATAAKVATTASGTYSPQVNDIIALTMTIANTANTVTLNIDNSGAKNVKVGGNSAGSISLNNAANGIVYLIYDGTSYNMFGSVRNTDSNTSYSEISDAETLVTTGSTARLISGRRLEYYKNNALIIDEDDMISNLATKMPSQQSVKAYVDAVSGTIPVKATSVDVGLGINDTKFVTPKGLKDVGMVKSEDGTVSNIIALTKASYDALTPAQKAGKTFITTDEIDDDTNAKSATANGYVQLPSGIIIQWGTFTGSGVKTFPTAFPNACLMVTASGALANQGTSPQYMTVSAVQGWTTTGFTAATIGFINTGAQNTAVTSQSYGAVNAMANFGGESRFIAIGY